MPANNNNSPEWFSVSKEGLALLVTKAHIPRELVANAFDEQKNGVTEVRVTLRNLDGNTYEIKVTDNSPLGFNDLTDSFTLFRPTPKQIDPTVRGRFNQGEKSVIAQCRSACISTTKGHVNFSDLGRSHGNDATKVGTEVELIVDLDVEDIIDIDGFFSLVIVPEGISLFYNDTQVMRDKDDYVGTAEAKAIPTVLRDEKGIRPTKRNCSIEVYEVNTQTSALPGYLFELGIPVCETGDEYDYNVMQKVPLDMSRDTVSEKFLQCVRGAVANVLVAENLMDEGTAAERLALDALGSTQATVETKRKIVETRHGTRHLLRSNPMDGASNDRATVNGFSLLNTASYPEEARDFLREEFGTTTEKFGREIKLMQRITTSKWTDKMRWLADLTQYIAKYSLERAVGVVFYRQRNDPSGAKYDDVDHKVCFNMANLPKSWFAKVEEVIDLIIHELAHQYGNEQHTHHYSTAYYKGISKIGGIAVKLALRAPQKFKCPK